MPTFMVTSPDGKQHKVTAPEGATQEDAIAYVKNSVGYGVDKTPAGIKEGMKSASEGFGARIEREIRGIPRQIGLTARDVIEGVADTAGIVSNPLSYLAEKATGQPMMNAGQLGTYAADSMGLPTPQGQQERAINAAAKVMIPVGGQAALAAKGARMAPGAAQAISQQLAAAPGAQLAGAAGGGAASQYAADTGGGPGAQFIAGLAGGFGGAAGAGAMTAGIRSLSSLVNDAVGTLSGTKATLADINSSINAILKTNGIKITDISGPVRRDLVKEMRRAMDTGAEVDPAVLQRIADYGVVGATPLKGNVTLDPVQITQERNLAKMGANSPDPRMQALARNQRQNDIRLTQNLNEMGADKAVEPRLAGMSIQERLKALDLPRKSAVDEAYQAVRDSSGRYANIDVPAFSNMANDALDKNMLGSVLPVKAKGLLNDVSSGKIPLNVNTMAQLDKVLSGLRRDAYSSGDSQGALAIQKVRDALWSAPVESTAGQASLDKYHVARQMAAKRFKLIEDNPAMMDALDDVAPDKFVQTYITGAGGKANLRDVRALVTDLKQVPETYQSAREQILLHLKNKALSGAADEVGNFSPSNFNKAMNALGDSKLSLFFNEVEIARLKAVGRVASYEKFQPSGSAVNNSNTAGTAMGMFMKVLDSVAKTKIPVLKWMASSAADAANNQANKVTAGKSLIPSFTKPALREPSFPSAFPMAIPAAVGYEANQ